MCLNAGKKLKSSIQSKIGNEKLYYFDISQLRKHRAFREYPNEVFGLPENPIKWNQKYVCDSWAALALTDSGNALVWALQDW